MSNQSSTGITVEKSLHIENAKVTSMSYASKETPALIEAVEVKGSEEVFLVRTSCDNGKTWQQDSTVTKQLHQAGGISTLRESPYYYLDPDNGLLIEFFTQYDMRSGEDFTFGPDADMEIAIRTRKLHYRISRDEGMSWEPSRQLIQKGEDYDENHWCSGVYFGKNTLDPTPVRIVKLPDGTLLMPIWIYYLGEDGQMVKLVDRFGVVKWQRTSSACLLGRWRKDLSDIDWDMSNDVRVHEHVSFGTDEPSVASMDDGKLMMLMRGDASGLQIMPGVKFFSISEDDGRTWGPAVPLTYPDGGFVNSPSSIAWLFRSSKNKRVYLIANILTSPARMSDPRHPLQIAEIDPKYFWVKPETVTVIDDRQSHHPKFVRFSNWIQVEDRETGDLALYMTDARIDPCIPDTPGELSPHSFRYDIHLPD